MKKFMWARPLPIAIFVMVLVLLTRTGDIVEKLVASGIGPRDFIQLKTANAEDKKADSKTEAKPEAKGEKPAETSTAAPDGEGAAPAADKAAAAAEADIEAQDEMRPLSEVALLQQLNDRREALNAREEELNQRETLLKAAEAQFDQKMAELNTLKADIEKLTKEAEGKQEAEMAGLVKIYETMKPKDAANIFNTLETNTLLALMGRMKEGKLATILAAMSPDRAKQVTVELAQRAQRLGPKTQPTSEKTTSSSKPVTKP